MRIWFHFLFLDSMKFLFQDGAVPNLWVIYLGYQIICWQIFRKGKYLCLYWHSTIGWYMLLELFEFPICSYLINSLNNIRMGAGFQVYQYLSYYLTQPGLKKVQMHKQYKSILHSGWRFFLFLSYLLCLGKWVCYTCCLEVYSLVIIDFSYDLGYYK